MVQKTKAVARRGHAERAVRDDGIREKDTMSFQTKNMSDIDRNTAEKGRELSARCTAVKLRTPDTYGWLCDHGRVFSLCLNYPTINWELVS